ncbi:MAG: hypothetical protein PHT44_04675 [Candidatus Portnoybacteria bacterium]|nr:hypothetical protein [Candidatus Portnoybacteria bacterium]
MTIFKQESVTFVGEKFNQDELEVLRASGFFNMVNRETDKVFKECEETLSKLHLASKHEGEFENKGYFEWKELLDKKVIDMSHTRVWQVHREWTNTETNKKETGLLVYNNSLRKTWEVITDSQ